MRVAVLGASDKQDRYSYKALMKLQEHDHEPIPIHPRLKEIEGLTVYPSLADVPGEVDTVTVYLSAANSAKVEDGLIACKPRRVIFNPGAENPELAARLRDEGIEVVEACTLVLLSTNQF